jgi:hypothetical protein
LAKAVGTMAACASRPMLIAARMAAAQPRCDASVSRRAGKGCVHGFLVSVWLCR